MRKTVLGASLLVLAVIASAGCDAVGRHKALSVIFDGVPSLPPPEEICEQYAAIRVAEVRDELSGKKSVPSAVVDSKSQHAPYLEKRCNDCHDKKNQNGLITSRTELCMVCHTGFVKGLYVHGPVAVGDCSACHLPHSSNYPSLLRADKNAICLTCHREKRTASAMHDKLAAQRIGCTDCHDPHFGNAPFFLK
ncbi:cytochrome c3 family protein [Geobacter sp. SVR]|uniref:cytochrome c3 family protein n=1 Tax=Geobacter sp. SVR TaxID=2495594 RepID=UPI00143EF9FA|nr:cytochrome c3 family protein [Geobacter sp. SVR]BCS53273.1 cytochrome c [Geobacter sp. SVR]GCF85601.1 cytochrome c [Geobacter sp. SVR]